MKRALLFCSMFTLSLFAFAQDSTIALSKLEKFYSQTNRLIKVNTMNLGDIGRNTFSKIKAIDITSGASDSAISIYPTTWENPDLLNNEIVYIPYEELDTVINILKYFSTEVAKGNDKASKRYNYTTSSDINISCDYTYSFIPGWSISFSRVYQHLRTRVSSSCYYFNKRDLENIIQILRLARKEI